MSVEILHDVSRDRACLTSASTETAFGPLFIGLDCFEQAEAFLEWLQVDPRSLSPELLEESHTAWCRIALDEDGSLRERIEPNCDAEAFELAVKVLERARAHAA